MKGILMTPWKAQAIHESSPEREWQDRRIIKEQKLWWVDVQPHPNGGWVAADFNISEANYRPTGIGFKCPYTIGEKVYIEETFCKVCYENDGIKDVCFKGDMITPCGNAVWKSPSFLTADLARTIVEITDIRAQRVQDISLGDMEKEGLRLRNRFGIDFSYGLADYVLKGEFKTLWNSIHGEGAWERNDWVWISSFRRIER